MGVLKLGAVRELQMTVVGRGHHLHVQGVGTTRLSPYIQHAHTGAGLPGDGEVPTPRTGRGRTNQTEKAGVHLHGMTAGVMDGVGKRQVEQVPAAGGLMVAMEKMEENKTEMYEDDQLVLYPPAP